MRNIWIVFTKEMIDNLRDRRSVLSGLAVGPAVMLIFFLAGNFGASMAKKRIEGVIQLGVVGQEYAANLVGFLEGHDVRVRSVSGDPALAVGRGDLGMVLVITAPFPEDFRAGRPAHLKLVLDKSEKKALRQARQVETVLQAYAGQIGALRLMARGIDPTVIKPLVIEREGAAAKKGALFLSLLLPYLIFFSAFMGGYYLSIDITTGEKERGSLEPLLINPVPRWQFVLGKWGAVMVFMAMAVLLTLAGLLLSVKLVPGDMLPVPIELDFLASIVIFLVTVPLIVFFGALEMVVAVFCRSSKEAQTYLGILAVVMVLPGLFGAMLDEPQSWMTVVPVLSQQQLFDVVIHGNSPALLEVALSAGTATIIAIGLLWVTIVRYRHEKIIL